MMPKLCDHHEDWRDLTVLQMRDEKKSSAEIAQATGIRNQNYVRAIARRIRLAYEASEQAPGDA